MQQSEIFVSKAFAMANSLARCRPWLACAMALAVGCENGAGGAAAADAVVDAHFDGDAADADATGVDVQALDAPDGATVDAGDGTTGDPKNCPVGSQIKGCPCTIYDEGCCVQPNLGLGCSPDKSLNPPYIWTEIADCCTQDAPYCGAKPDSGFSPLCLSK